MIVEIGHFMLVSAFVLSLFQLVFVGYGSFKGNVPLMVLARPLTIMVAWLVLAAFLALSFCYLTSDFSVRNVAENSHSETPFLYKITAIWGNHEGSMLLWLLILSIFSSAFAFFGRPLRLRFYALVLMCQNALFSSFLAFILSTSNPFRRLDPAPLQGAGLNPLLQDIGLALHPPLLYLGLVGCSLVFSFAIAALLEGFVDNAFARFMRPWLLLSWLFLTAGITLGSYWAYYELGWGGYWFWDPVENASLMPWLTATALLHSALMLEKRASLILWTLLLAIITFSLILFGTFLVRSNLLGSVHNFAASPGRGLALLVLLSLFSCAGFGLFAWRAPQMRRSQVFLPFTREGALIFNNIFLSTAAACIFIGTFYPLILELLTGDKITVGPPFFNLTFGALMAVLMFVMPFGPLLSWKQADIYRANEQLMLAACASLAVFVLTLFLTGDKETLAHLITAFMSALAIWLILGSFSDIIAKSGHKRRGIFARLRRACSLPLSVYGVALAHMGVGITLAGIVAVSAFEEEYITTLGLGDELAITDKSLRFEGGTPHFGSNYLEDRFTFTLLQQETPLKRGHAAKRIFSVLGFEAVETSEVALFRRGLSHYYIAVGSSNEAGHVVVHVWYKPYVLAIWLGGFFMMVGAIFSLLHRIKQRNNQSKLPVPLSW